MTTVETDLTPHTFLDRLALWLGWAVAIALFYVLGWMAMDPNDPLGAVSLIARHGAGAALLQAAGLAAVAAAIATVLSGRRLSYAGPFAAALGMSVVSLRGATAEYLILSAASGNPAVRSLAPWYILEAVGWVGVVFVSIGVSSVTTRWCFGSLRSEIDEQGGSSPVTNGLKFSMVAAIASLVSFAVLTTGLEQRAIQHGQVCFVVGASVWLGCFVAHRLVVVRSAVWSILAVALVAGGGYLWAGLRPVKSTLPAGVPTSHFLRVLPIQFVSVGTAAAIAAFWSMLRHRALYAEDRESAKERGASESRR